MVFFLDDAANLINETAMHWNYKEELKETQWINP
jgi:hypothetical protein